MSVPKVSVIIPSYNRSRVLAASLDSVLAQEFKDFELIVVDDGSEDDTQELLKKYGDKVKVIKLEKNMGCAAARNQAIESAQAELIAFHDSDDQMLPDRLDAQVRFMDEHLEVAGATGDVIFGDEENARYLEESGIEFGEQDYVILEKPFTKLLCRDFMANPASMIRKKSLIEVGCHDVSLQACSDWDMWLKISRRWPLACMQKAVTRIGIDGSNINESSHGVICRIRVIDRYLQLNDIEDNSAVCLIKKRLFGLIGSYVLSNLDKQLDSDWRATSRSYTKYLSPVQKFLVGIASRFPRFLRFFLNIVRSLSS